MSLLLSRIHATPRWRAAERSSRMPSLWVFLFSFPTVPLSREDRARDFKRAARRARSRLCPVSRTYLADRARPGDGTAAARSPSEVKVRRVGTGCARIHFFGLALDFFSSSRPARRAASVPMYANRPSLHGWLARYPRAAHAHGTRSCASHVSRRFSLPHFSFFLLLALVLSLHRTNTRASPRTHVRVWYRWYSSRL